ncbi:MAG: hypothetical protein CVU05_00115 [Bacteroidetes bacterium HGW-Bacteroidetes-21]|jgi:hypothetical protein|nr:MAG: hypothetical protein CVU05_00115 [Bacteroidetes bacterium HGW-Bacteroidetes-21]
MFKYLIFSALIILSACSGTRQVIPLKAKEHNVAASLGGPMIKFSGLVIPMPLTSVAWSYGINDTYTTTTAIHTTSMLFGVIHFEGSVLSRVYLSPCTRSGITVSPGFHAMADIWEGKFSFYPFADFMFYRTYNEGKGMFYAGPSLMFDVRSTKAFDVKNTNRIIPWFSAGYKWNRPKISYSVELKYLNFTRNNQNIVVEYIAPGNKGALGIYFGLSKTF